MCLWGSLSVYSSYENKFRGSNFLTFTGKYNLSSPAASGEDKKQNRKVHRLGREICRGNLRHTRLLMPIITLLCLGESQLITNRLMRGLGEAQEALGRCVPSSSGFQQHTKTMKRGRSTGPLSLHGSTGVRTSKNGSGLSRKRLPAVVMRLV